MTQVSNRRPGWRPAPWSIAMWAVIAVILITPLVAMQFSTGVNWTASDFAFAGALLIGGGVVFECVVRLIRRPALRALIAAAILAVVGLIWAEGAVGIF